jgi:hypothetical protein
MSWDIQVRPLSYEAGRPDGAEPSTGRRRRSTPPPTEPLTSSQASSQDRERPDTYVQMVEFPSYEEAMANSALPETTAIAEKLSALCVSGPTFRNLDIVRVDEL